MSPCAFFEHRPIVTPPPAQPSAQQSTILTFGADGSLDIGQLKSVFGMELGTTVALKKDSSDNVLHIALAEGHTTTLVGADGKKITVTTGELVDLYKVVKVEPDVLVRSADFLKFEDDASARTKYFSSYAEQLLFQCVCRHEVR